MDAETDPQYTEDGERENPEQMPDNDPADSGEAVPENTGGSRTDGGAGMVQTE